MNALLDRLDDASPFIHSAIFIIGATGNLILLFATVFGTPKTIKVKKFSIFVIIFSALLYLSGQNELSTYSILIKCGTVSDLICLFCDFLTMKRLLIVPWNVLYLFMGPCVYVSTRFCYIVHCTEIITLVYSGYVMLASFAFRLWILHQPSPSSCRVRIAMVLIWFPPALVGFAFMFADADVNFLREYLSKYAPQYLSEPGALSGHYGLTPHMIFTIIYVISAPIPIYAGLIIMRHKILTKLREFADGMSAQSRNMHRNFVKALTLHASLCPITISGVLIYVALFFEIYYHPAMEKAVYTFAAFPPALTPYGFLYYVRPYRLFVLSFFRRVPIARTLMPPTTVVHVSRADMTTVSS